MHKSVAWTLSGMLLFALCGADMTFPANARADRKYECHMTGKEKDAVRYTALGAAVLLALAAYGLLIWRTVRDSREKSAMESPFGVSGSGLPYCPEGYREMAQPVFFMQENAPGHVRVYGFGLQKRF